MIQMIITNHQILIQIPILIIEVDKIAILVINLNKKNKNYQNKCY